MPVYENTVALRTLQMSASWQDIVGLSILPIDCNLVILYNAGTVDILFRTDPNNANSQAVIGPGEQAEIGSVEAPLISERYRFIAGSPYPVGSVSSAGTPN